MAFSGLGSNTQLGIGIAIRMYDQYSAQVKGAEKALKKLRQAANTETMGAIQDARNRYAGIAAGAGVLTAGLMKANKESAELEHTIRKIAIIGGDMTGKTQKKLEDMVFRLGDQFGSSYGDVAAAILENTKAGIKDNIELVTKYQIAVSKVADEQLGGSGGVAAGMINIANQFHLNTSEMGRVGNALAAAANASKADISSLNEGMKQFGSTAYQMGLSPEKAIAMLAKVENAGLTGSMGGTHVRNFFVQAVKNSGKFMSKQNAAAWAELGIDPGKMRELIDSGNADQLINLVQKSVMGKKRSERVEYLNKLFNLRGQSGIQALFGLDKHGNELTGKTAQGGEQKTYQQLYLETQAGVTGDIVMKQAKANSDDFWTDMNKLKNAMTQFWYKFYSNVKPFLRIAYQFAAKFMRIVSMVTETSLGKVLSVLVMLGAPLITVLFGLKAAVMGAIYALNMMSIRSRFGGAGGFWNLAGAGLAPIGARGARATLARNRVSGWTPGFQAAHNVHGNPYVAAGQRINIGPQAYVAGKALPRSMNWGVTAVQGASMLGAAGGRAAGAAGAAAAGRTALGIGRSLVSGVGGIFMRFIPIVGGILTIVSLIELITDLIQSNNEEEKANQDPIERYYSAALNRTIFSQREAEAAKMWQQSHGLPFTNNIVVNVDGTQVANETQQVDMSSNINKFFVNSAISQ